MIQDPFIFSGETVVQLQNGRLLQLLDRQLETAAFAVADFGAELLLLDYRHSTLAAIDGCQHQRQVRQFAGVVSQPARTDIWRLGPDQLVVELFDLAEAVATPPTMLWLGTQPAKLATMYDTIYQQSHPWQNGKTAVLSLYATPAPSTWSLPRSAVPLTHRVSA